MTRQEFESEGYTATVGVYHGQMREVLENGRFRVTQSAESVIALGSERVSNFADVRMPDYDQAANEARII